MASAAAALAGPLENLVTAIENDDDSGIVSAAVHVLSAIGQIVTAAGKLGTALDALSSSASGLSASQRAALSSLAQQLARRLFDYTVIDYLSTKGRSVVPVLALTGLIDNDLVPADPADPHSVPYLKRTIHFERLGNMLSNPAGLFQTAFKWGTAGFDGSLIFPRIADLVDALNLPVDIFTPPGSPTILDAYIFPFRGRSNDQPALAHRTASIAGDAGFPAIVPAGRALDADH